MLGEERLFLNLKKVKVMKDSYHHRKHENHKALRDAEKKGQTDKEPSDLVMNQEFKHQFDAKTPASCSCCHHKKTSKRTSPGEVKQESEPSHFHHESERWHQVVQSKNNEKTKLFDKKQSKHHK